MNDEIGTIANALPIQIARIYTRNIKLVTVETKVGNLSVEDVKNLHEMNVAGTPPRLASHERPCVREKRS